jgi:hypothetical protein
VSCGRPSRAGTHTPRAARESQDARQRLGRTKRPPPPARRSTAASRPGKQQASAKSHQLLAAALAEGRITVERAAELLKVGTREVEQIAAGKVGLSKSAWQRLLRGLE